MPCEIVPSVEDAATPEGAKANRKAVLRKMKEFDLDGSYFVLYTWRRQDRGQRFLVEADSLGGVV